MDSVTLIIRQAEEIKQLKDQARIHVNAYMSLEREFQVSKSIRTVLMTNNAQLGRDNEKLLGDMQNLKWLYVTQQQYLNEVQVRGHNDKNNVIILFLSFYHFITL
jgi:hypothetical protein